MVAAGNALCQLTQILPGKQVPKLGLADQDDLQQFLFRGLQVGQQPHLLKHVARKVLRLVDDEYDAASVGMSLEQLPVQGIHQCLDAAPDFRRKDSEFLANGLEELDDREARVQNDGDVGVIRELVLQQSAHEGRLAGSDLTGELHETATLGNAVNKVRECLAVTFAHKQITRVGRYREWLFIKSEETRIHD